MTTSASAMYTGKREEVLVFGYIRMIQNIHSNKLIIPTPIYYIVYDFCFKFAWIEKTVTIQVVGNEDNRKTGLNQYLSVHGTNGIRQMDTINNESIKVISHINKLKKGVWEIKQIENNKFVICHIGCIDGRKTARNFYLTICDNHSVPKRDDGSKYTMVVKDMNKASKFTFLRTQILDDNIYFIQIINDKKQCLTVHSSNHVRDFRDLRSHYVHLRDQDHKSTIWKFEPIDYP